MSSNLTDVADGSHVLQNRLLLEKGRYNGLNVYCIHLYMMETKINARYNFTEAK